MSINDASQSDNGRWSELMASAQMGCESDYRQLLTELANVIHGYLKKRFGDQEFIEDCVQETLLAIHKARHTYDPQRPFRPWFFTIVRHKVIDYLRHKSSRIQHTESYQLEALDLVSQSASVEDCIDEENLLLELSAPHREALTLTKLVGLSSSEAAKQLGISESALKVRVHRAINKLKHLIEAED
ncbi:RNA polymerase sigma factor [Pseudoalteromonas sp. T1lg22]|uniref:RNA polymerase sigma factor n=1 Tax=Pseudoalteromonas sp. T1lg22 TaxID=2077096 RepID=UPI000CF731BC|nr:sigma-70 family RNA polymerase sigma factor [Pseudoalteromonas sp. T1lg22]